MVSQKRIVKGSDVIPLLGSEQIAYSCPECGAKLTSTLAATGFDRQCPRCCFLFGFASDIQKTYADANMQSSMDKMLQHAEQLGQGVAEQSQPKEEVPLTDEEWMREYRGAKKWNLLWVLGWPLLVLTHFVKLDPPHFVGASAGEVMLAVIVWEIIILWCVAADAKRRRLRPHLFPVPKSRFLLSCPKCGELTPRGGRPLFQIVCSVLLFPFGLLTLLAGRDPTVCKACGFRWQV